jgi:hypothetical protein
VLAWLLFAHLVADFVLQNDWIALNKGRGGRSGWSALGVHGFHAAVCLVPVVFAFGLPGLAYLVLIGLTHMVVDRWKVRATALANERAQARARARLASGGPAPAPGLGAAWTPWPGMLFVADQVLHVVIAVVGWLVILQGAMLLPEFVDAVDTAVGRWDPVTVHAVTLTSVVLASLFIINTRGGYYFVLALASPRHIRPVEGAEEAEVRGVETPPTPRASPVPAGAQLRIATTVAAIERLVMVALVLVGVAAGALLVVAFDLAVRWRELGQREFADWYLVATLGSVAVALSSGLLAAAALATLA